MTDIPREIEAISVRYSKQQNNVESQDQCILDTYILAQTCFMIFVDVLVDTIADLYWDPLETGSASRGTVIKGAHLSGIFRVMNTASANPELFLRIYNTTRALPIVKKQWVEAAKEAKKKTKNEKTKKADKKTSAK
jgi:hypothetical protein